MTARPEMYRFHNGEKAPLQFAVSEYEARVAKLRAIMAAMGVEAARLDELTEMALEDPSCGGNPVTMTRENTRALFQACM